MLKQNKKCRLNYIRSTCLILNSDVILVQYAKKRKKGKRCFFLTASDVVIAVLIMNVVVVCQF